MILRGLAVLLICLNLGVAAWWALHEPPQPLAPPARDDEISVLTRAFTRLGQALGLDWAQSTAARITTGDPWERLLISGVARDMQQVRLDFLAQGKGLMEAARVLGQSPWQATR